MYHRDNTEFQSTEFAALLPSFPSLPGTAAESQFWKAKRSVVGERSVLFTQLLPIPTLAPWLPSQSPGLTWLSSSGLSATNASLTGLGAERAF